MFCKDYFLSETKIKLQLLAEGVFFLICAKRIVVYFPFPIPQHRAFKVKKYHVHAYSISEAEKSKDITLAR